METFSWLEGTLAVVPYKRVSVEPFFRFTLLERDRLPSPEELCLERPSNDSNYQELLECAVCYEILYNPRVLSCEHQFCKECIDEMTKCREKWVTLTCPTCQAEQKFENGLCQIKTPLLLKQMLDKVNRYHFLVFGFKTPFKNKFLIRIFELICLIDSIFQHF